MPAPPGLKCRAGACANKPSAKWIAWSTVRNHARRYASCRPIEQTGLDPPQAQQVLGRMARFWTIAQGRQQARQRIEGPARAMRKIKILSLY